jgi:hypothetical protein
VLRENLELMKCYGGVWMPHNVNPLLSTSFEPPPRAKLSLLDIEEELFDVGHK